jgi:hypothetical protein
MTKPLGDRYRGVRYRDDTGFEMRCDSCPNSPLYWPLTTEFWDTRAGFSRCRACWLVHWRHRAEALRRADPEQVRARERRNYRRNRRVILIKRREYYARNREEILVKRREYYRENRDRILEMQRQRKAA